MRQLMPQSTALFVDLSISSLLHRYIVQINMKHNKHKISLTKGTNYLQIFHNTDTVGRTTIYVQGEIIYIVINIGNIVQLLYHSTYSLY